PHTHTFVVENTPTKVSPSSLLTDPSPIGADLQNCADTFGAFLPGMKFVGVGIRGGQGSSFSVRWSATDPLEWFYDQQLPSWVWRAGLAWVLPDIQQLPGGYYYARQMHFNEQMTWSTGFNASTNNVRNVCMLEFTHILGVPHFMSDHGLPFYTVPEPGANDVA